MNALEGIIKAIENLAKRIGRLESQGQQRWVYLSAPLTSTSWDGDGKSTTAKTLLDLSTVFSAPAGIRAAYVLVVANDSASAAATTTCWIILSPNDTAGSGMIHRVSGMTNDSKHATMMTVPCDANGDFYYQINASGSTTLDVTIEIWGYLI